MFREKKKDLNKRLYILKKVLRCLGGKKWFKQAVVYSQKGLEMFREKKENQGKLNGEWRFIVSCALFDNFICQSIWLALPSLIMV